MGSRRRCGRLAAAGCALALAAVAPAARADDARGGGGFLLYMLGVIVPGEIGLDRAVAPDAAPRLRVGWVYQIPFGCFAPQSDSDWRAEASPLWQHRIVVSAALSYGFDGSAAARDFRQVGGDFRGGYRYRFRHRTGLAPYLGLGVGYGGGGDGEVYLSPELGIHFGRDAVGPGVQLGLQGDAFFDGSTTRIQAVAVWTVW